LTQYFALTERRSEGAKRIRREYREKYGKDFSPRRAKVIVPRDDMLANCVTATQGIEQYLLEIITEEGDILTETNVNQPKRDYETTSFTYVSLFSGIGGFEQALNNLGGTCVLASEIDRFANQAYEALYGEPTVGDITKVAAQDVPDHDVLVGGFPCQAFSVAGKRGGFDDARGTLFFEAARIAAEKQPKLVLLENVKGLVGHDKGRTLDTIVKTLNEIGYTVDFNVLNSKYFGVPQNRERIFIVGVRDDLAEPNDWMIEGNNVVAKGKRRISGYDDVKTFNFDWPAQGEVTVRLRDILESNVDEKYYLSEEKTVGLISQLENGLAVKEATTKGYAVAEEGDAVNFQFPNSKTRRGRVGKQIAQTLEASSINQGVVEEVRPVLTPERPNKRQNGRRFKENDEEAFTLTSIDRHGIAIGEYPSYRIRKLTPLECFRLQGFSDEAHQTLVDAGISNSQRYKQAGNAVTVNVIEAIGEKLLPLLHSSNRSKA
jgi:DNA (cytosine-5)-methyltransferase 1